MNLSEFNIGEVWKVRVEGGFRYALIVSPNSMNQQIDQLVVIGISARKKSWPTRVDFQLQRKSRQLCLEEISSLSKENFIQRVQTLSLPLLAQVKVGLKQLLVDF